MCREPISRDVERLRGAGQPVELQNAPDFELTSDLKSLQLRMTNLFLHQKERGGIIDLDAEEINVISIQTEEANERVSKRQKTFQINQLFMCLSENLTTLLYVFCMF